MKKYIIILLVALVGLLSFIAYKKYNKSESDLTTIRVAEVTHSVFYAPMYVAIEQGYFEEVGINLELILTPGADKVSAAVLSNDVEIGFAGTESSIYIYSGDEEDYLVTFAGVTKRDGQFIVAKEKNNDFKWEDLIGSHVLVGRQGGMPALSFENALKNAGVDSKKVDMDYSIEFAALVGSFIGGNGDYVNLFEPNATKLEKEGYAYVVASIGELAGEVPYTAFYARGSYIQNNQEIIEKFTEAIAKGLNFVEENTAENVAKTIINQFPDSSVNDVATIIERYKKYDSWLSTPFITEESFNNLQNIMLDAGQIKEYVPYNKLINNFYKK